MSPPSGEADVVNRAGHGNLLAAGFWAVLFYIIYGLSFVLSSVVPPGAVLLGRWIDSLIKGFFGLQVPIQIDQLTVLAACYAELLILYVYARTISGTFVHPTGIVAEALLESHTNLMESGGEMLESSLSSLERLTDEVTERLQARPFAKVTIVTEPTAETRQNGRRRKLVLGWPLLYHLTENELKAIIAHEAAHYDRHAAFAHRWIWRLNQKISFHQRLTEDTLERLKLKEQRKGGGRLGLTLPMLESALGLSASLLVVPQKKFLRRLGRENYPFEFYCDAVAIGAYGANNLRSALEKVDLLKATFAEFYRDLRLAPAGNIFDQLEEFQRCQSVQEEIHAESYWTESTSHPSLRSRLQKLVGFQDVSNQTSPWLDPGSRSGFSVLEQELTAETNRRLINGRKMFEEGRAFAKAGDLVRAGPILREATAAYLQPGEAWGWLGVYYVRMRDFYKAHDCLLKAWRSMRTEKWEEQAEFHSSFLVAAQKCGGPLEAWVLYGSGRLEKGRYDPALDAFDTVLIWDSSFEDPLPLFGKGRCLEGLSRLGEAERCYQTAWERHPDNSAVAIKLANVITARVTARIWTGRVIPSDPYKIIELERESPVSNHNVSRLKNALELCDRLLRKPKTELYISVVATRAAVLRMLRDYAGAAACYKEILRENPSDNLARQFLTACLAFVQTKKG